MVEKSEQKCITEGLPTISFYKLWVAPGEETIKLYILANVTVELTYWFHWSHFERQFLFISSKDKLALLDAGSDVKHYGTEADSEYSSRTDDLTSEASYSIDTQSDISSVNSFYPYPETPRERVFQVVGTFVDIQGFIYGHVKTGGECGEAFSKYILN